MAEKLPVSFRFGAAVMADVKSHSGVKLLPRSSLKPFGNNSRTHSDNQIRQIADAITRFGFTNPILVSEENTIIAGHGRFLAAALLGMANVPCITLTGLTSDELRAYVIADNKLAENAGWDKELLGLELGSLERADFDLSVIGFSEKDLEKLLAEPDPDTITTPAQSADELAVVVSCESEAEQKDAYDLLVSHGFACRTAELKGVVSAG